MVRFPPLLFGHKINGDNYNKKISTQFLMEAGDIYYSNSPESSSNEYNQKPKQVQIVFLN